jgi:hypothetical protein
MTQRVRQKALAPRGGLLAEVGPWLLAAGLMAVALVIYFSFSNGAKQRIQIAPEPRTTAGAPTMTHGEGDVPQPLESSKTLTAKGNSPSRPMPVAPEVSRERTGQPRGESKNPAIDPKSVSPTDPATAAAFLREVEVYPHDGGGFFVQDVEPDSFYERVGLEVGDVVQKLERDSRSGKIRVEVVRDGQRLVLTDSPDDQ